MSSYPLYALVLYKKRPARVVKLGERMEIEMEGGNIAKVRPKDIELLHPGPIHNLKQMISQSTALNGDLQMAWELLTEAGGEHSIAELAELGFDAYTPAATWAAWAWVEDGLYFHGRPEAITAIQAKEVEQESRAREVRRAEAAAWKDFISRAGIGKVSAATDAVYLREVEDLAFGRRDDSRVLRELGRHERPETAHALLLDWGVWDVWVNPHPVRLGMALHSPGAALPPLPDEDRCDLTGIPAYAIDDRKNEDPDDAISLIACETDPDGGMRQAQVWVHVADAATLAPPDSPADLEARERAATLYLPEGPIPMLHPAAIPALGLGLNPISPALSFNIKLDNQAQIASVEIVPSWVKVERLTYEQVEEQIEDEPFHSLAAIAEAYHTRRARSGAFLLDLPEVTVRAVGGEVTIEPLPRLHSRDMVREIMLMAGEAAARFALQQELPFPFAGQEASTPQVDLSARDHPGGAIQPAPETLPLSARFALRRTLKRSQVTGQPLPHSGVGLSAYSRVTSPLRRYLDLVAHQQIRLHLTGDQPMPPSDMLERIGAAEALTGTVTQAELLSRRHWTLVYLLQHPEWHGKGVLVEKNGLRGYLLVPELALETAIHLRHDLPLDAPLPLSVQSINLPELEVQFKILEP